MKRLFFTTLLCMSLVIAYAQPKDLKPIFSFTAVPGTELTMTIRVDSDAQDYYADLGDGKMTQIHRENLKVDGLSSATRSSILHIVLMPDYSEQVRGNGHITIYGHKLESIEVLTDSIVDMDLSHAQDVTSLVLDANFTFPLDLSQTPKLHRLDIRNKHLTALDISPLTSLTLLSLDDTPISELDFSHTPNIERLQLGENNISNLDLSPLNKLDAAIIGRGKYNSVDFSHNPKLRQLTVDSIQCTSLDLSKNDQLQWLKVYGTKLESIDLSQSESISAIELNKNPLSELYLGDRAKQITTLYVTRSHIDHIDLSQMTSLKMLDLSYNRLTEIDLTHNTSIRSLNLSYNNIKHVDISPLHEIRLLVLNNMGLEEFILPKEVSLWNANLSNNKLKTIDLSNLQESMTKSRSALNISNNDITDIKWGEIIPTTLIITQNLLSFDKIPMTSKNCIYAPQKPLPIMNNGEHIDLSAMSAVNNKDGEKIPTTFVWKDAQNNTLIPDVDYQEVKPGFFDFLKVHDGVYCELSNAALPQFKDDQSFVTAPLDIKITTTITAPTASTSQQTDIYSLDGVLARHGNNMLGLPQGVYIVKTGRNRHKVWVKHTAN